MSRLAGSKIGSNQQSAAQENNILKARIKDLEGEVGRLKSRLDELRKAKNNTILKREREIIHVGEPGLGRPVGVEQSKYRELEKKLAESDAQLSASKKEFAEAKQNLELAHKEKLEAERNRDEWKSKYDELQDKMKAMEIQYDLDVQTYKAQVREKATQVDDLTAELIKLREKLEVKAMQEEHKHRENTDRESFISTLTNENAYLREKIETLYMELSVKEAQWTEKEEKFKLELKKEWSERYEAWMKSTEKKLAELHEANQMLKSCLYKGERKHKDNLKGFEDEDDDGTSSSAT